MEEAPLLAPEVEADSVQDDAFVVFVELRKRRRREFFREGAEKFFGVG